jgi:hypothetical protein
MSLREMRVRVLGLSMPTLLDYHAECTVPSVMGIGDIVGPATTGMEAEQWCAGGKSIEILVLRKRRRDVFRGLRRFSAVVWFRAHNSGPWGRLCSQPITGIETAVPALARPCGASAAPLGRDLPCSLNKRLSCMQPSSTS